MSLGGEFELIKQGAEAKLYKGTYLGKCTLVKERFQKNYRHAELDNYLTKERIKAEARSTLRCKSAGISTPAIYMVDLERRSIYMEYIENSITVKDYLTSLVDKEENSRDLEILAQLIGRAVGRMHANKIIHGDLTTSNMLLTTCPDETKTLTLIDFGLSYSESMAEDKAVDLYVLERAILSTHTSMTQFFPKILSFYSKENSKDSASVLKKLHEVRARGRKRTMVG